MTARYWTYLVYPDSAKDNWKTILRERGIATAVSPLHDKDTTITGEIKKPHYHCISYFEGKKSYDQVRRYVSIINGVIGPEEDAVVDNPPGLEMYLTHDGCPDKYQYNKDDIELIAGYTLSDKSRYLSIIDVIKLCEENNISNYRDLINFCYYTENYIVAKWAVNHCIAIKSYFGRC